MKSLIAIVTMTINGTWLATAAHRARNPEARNPSHARAKKATSNTIIFLFISNSCKLFFLSRFDRYWRIPIQGYMPQEQFHRWQRRGECRNLFCLLLPFQLITYVRKLLRNTFDFHLAFKTDTRISGYRAQHQSGFTNLPFSRIY